MIDYIKFNEDEVKLVNHDILCKENVFKNIVKFKIVKIKSIFYLFYINMYLCLRS